MVPKVRADYAAANAFNQRLPLSSEALAGELFEAVRTVWLEAVKNIPYYAGLVAAGKAPAELSSWDDFKSIPALTRKELQEHPGLFLREGRPPDDFIKTGGSTGTPLKLGIDQSERDLMRIVKLAAWQKLGYNLDSRLFLIWGHSHLLGTGWKGRLRHVRRKMADWVLGYQRVDAYRLNRALCLRHAERLVRFKPTGIIGYASALDLFARHAVSFREEFRRLGVRFVLATSEPPPRDDTLDLLADLFACPVVQEYGGAEFGQVAFKTGGQAFRTYSQLHYLECDPPEPGGDGECPALVTTLYPRYCPLIRYRVGDALLRPERQPNGHVSSFEAVAGRLNDTIQLADGDAIHSVAIFHCIHQEGGILNIQMVIRDEGVEIHLISTTPGDAQMEARIRARLAQVHPSLAAARFTYVDDMVTSRAGKRRWFVDLRRKSESLKPRIARMDTDD